MHHHKQIIISELILFVIEVNILIPISSLGLNMIGCATMHGHYYRFFNEIQIPFQLLHQMDEISL